MTENQTALDGQSTIGAWRQHPVGKEIIDGIAAQANMDELIIRRLRNIPFERLVNDGGSAPAGLVDSLVAKVNSGSAGAAEPSRGWVETITPGRFLGRTTIVTGAASGMGRAVASRIAREGGRVVAVDLAKERLESLPAGLPEGSIIPVAADITRAEDIQRILDAVEGTVDALANVAGIADDFSPIHEVSDAMLERIFNVNVFGLVKLTRAVIPGMMKQRCGSIVNVASEASLRGSSSGLAYTAAKTAVIGLTRNTAFMYEKFGIRVNAVAPGGTMTGMRPVNTSLFGKARVESQAADVPIAIPEALAASITFLLSDDGVNINGAILPSDGGESVF